LIPDGICLHCGADIDGDHGEPSRDGNCTDNKIPLPDGDDAENDKGGSENESEIGEKKYTLNPCLLGNEISRGSTDRRGPSAYATIDLMRSVKANE
jgi:hypothetical protein